MRIASTVPISFKILILVLHLSCAGIGEHKIETFNVEASENLHFKPPSNSLDTLSINYPAVVFFGPDSGQLSIMKSITDPGAFESIEHEYYYLFRNAHAVIQKTHPQLKIEEAKSFRFIIFKVEGSEYCIDLDSKKEPYGVIAFNNINEPRHVDLANIDTELHFYFSKPN